MDKVYTVDEISAVVSEVINDYYSNIKKVILFGSYARGEEDEYSDIDLFVCDSPDFVRLQTFGFMSEIKEKLNKNVDLFVEKNVDKKSEFYKNILSDGVVIYG